LQLQIRKISVPLIAQWKLPEISLREFSFVPLIAYCYAFIVDA